MDCKQAKKLFIFRIEGTLAEDRSSELGEHLDTCAGCAQLISQLKSSLELIPSEKRSIPNAFLFARIEAKLAAANSEPEKKRLHTIYVLRPAALAMLVIISLALGFIVGMNNTRNANSAQSSASEISQIAGYYQMGINHSDTLEDYFATK